MILGMLLGVGLGIATLEEFLWHGKIEFVVRILAVAGHGGGVTPVSVLLAVFLTEERPRKKGDSSDNEELANCVVWVNSFYSIYPL